MNNNKIETTNSDLEKENIRLVGQLKKSRMKKEIQQLNIIMKEGNK